MKYPRDSDLYAIVEFATDLSPADRNTLALSLAGVPVRFPSGDRRVDGRSPFATVYQGLTFQTMPASMLRASDTYGLTVGTNINMTTFRTVARQMRGGVDFTAELPELPPDPVVSVAGTAPYVMMQGNVATVGDPDVYQFTFTQRSADSLTSHAWGLRMTRGWMAKTKPATAVMPDISAVTGFKTVWAIEKGREVQWQQFQFKSSDGIAAQFEAPAVKNEVVADRQSTTTQRLGKLTP